MKPKPPKHLTPEAKEEWGRILAELEQAGTLHRADRAALTIYIDHWQDWAHAKADIEKKGLVVKMPNGWPNHNPFVAIKTKAAAAMVRILCQFGLTPKSRGMDRGDEPEEAGDLEF